MIEAYTDDKVLLKDETIRKSFDSHLDKLVVKPDDKRPRYGLFSDSNKTGYESFIRRGTIRGGRNSLMELLLTSDETELEELEK